MSQKANKETIESLKAQLKAAQEQGRAATAQSKPRFEVGEFVDKKTGEKVRRLQFNPSYGGRPVFLSRKKAEDMLKHQKEMSIALKSLQID